MRWRRIKRTAWVGARLGLPLAGCNAELATRWVLPQPAVVRCTTAGRTRMPPVLLDLPLPSIPTGLLARQLDPMALDDMGFTRDQPICASLATPSPETIERVQPDLSRLLATYRRTGATAHAALGRCVCEVARATQVHDLVAPCHGKPHRPRCSPTPADLARLATRLAPLQQALASTSVPRVHWRLAGRSDRPQWIVRRLRELLPRYSAGATVFVPGQAIPRRNNHALIARLLEVDGTVAVLRLDGGRSVLVIRERQSVQILDLLSFPPIAPSVMPLLPFIDEARADEVVAMLEQPSTAWAPPLPLAAGNLVHLDRAGLRSVDALAWRMGPLNERSPAPGRSSSSEPAALFDAVTLQADFGAEGEVLRARVRLSEAGQRWAQTLTDTPLGTDLESLGLPVQPPTPAPPVAPRSSGPSDRSATQRLVFNGLQRLPAGLRTLEMFYPNAVQGTRDAWDISLPAGAIDPQGPVAVPLEFQPWAERIAAQPYRLRASFDSPRQFLLLVLTPD